MEIKGSSGQHLLVLKLSRMSLSPGEKQACHPLILISFLLHQPLSVLGSVKINLCVRRGTSMSTLVAISSRQQWADADTLDGFPDYVEDALRLTLLQSILVHLVVGHTFYLGNARKCQTAGVTSEIFLG